MPILSLSLSLVVVSRWITMLGFREEAEVFRTRKISQHALGHLRDGELANVCPR
jgi:hypothetical protein